MKQTEPKLLCCPYVDGSRATDIYDNVIQHMFFISKSSREINNLVNIMLSQTSDLAFHL